MACVFIACGSACTAAAQIRLSQSLDERRVTAGSGVACASGIGAFQTTADNRWSRAFRLSEYGVFQAFEVRHVEFGVEDVRLPTLPHAEIVIDLYQFPARSPPIVGGELVGSTTLVVTPSDLPRLEVITVNVEGVVDAGTALMVEVSVADFRILAGGELGDAFVIGANWFGETEDSYLASVACGIPEPRAFIFGLDVNHWIIIAEGDVATACRVDFDGDGSITIFDFLAFQNAFETGDLAADFDADGRFTILDFLMFQNEFDAGCE